MPKPPRTISLPAAFREEVSKRHIDTHESSVEPFHLLPGSAGLLRAGVDYQRRLIFPLVTPARGLKVGRGRFSVCQVNFPLDPCVGGSDLSRLYQRARVAKGIFIDPETCALALDPALVVFIAGTSGS